MNDIKEDKPRRTRKAKLVKVKNICNKNITGQDSIHKPGEVFKITPNAAKMLIAHNRVELVDDANSGEST